MQTPVLSVAGVTGQIYVNGVVGPVNGNVTLSLDPSVTGGFNTITSSGALLYGYIIGGDTNLSGSLVSMSGQLVSQIQSAAGVLSLNGVTGLLTLASASSGNAITTSGTTIYVSGNTRNLAASIAPGVDFAAVVFSPAFPGIPQVYPSVTVTGSVMYQVCPSGITNSGYNALFSATTTETIILNTFARYG